MARTVKAFASHDFFVDNTRLKESSFGELSTDARTFERDIAIYTHSTDKNISVSVFRSTNNGAVSAINTADLNLTLTIAKTVYDYTLKEAKEIFRDELRDHLLTQLSARAQRFEIGEVVNHDGFYCVQWVRWLDLSNNEFQLWFSDKAFKSEYDDGEIAIVAPVTNLDIFFGTRTIVEAELAKTPIDLLTKKANATKGNTPVTVFRLDIFKWYNPTNKKPELDTNWYILIWGDANDNIDAVREKLQEFILKNSTKTRDEWKEVFPDIFKRNEFILVPQWDVFSNENKVKEQASLYSPFMEYDKMITKYGTPFMNEMPATHVRKYGQSTSLYYRSICAFTCGSQENRDNKFQLTDNFPDFIDVPSTSTDFNYQTTKTQNWSLKIQDMLAVAEVMTPTSMLPREKITLPGGEIIQGEKIYTRVTRNNKLFLVMRYEGFHYLVAAKHSFNKP